MFFIYTLLRPFKDLFAKALFSVIIRIAKGVMKTMKESREPKFQTIIDDIKNKIAQKELKPHDYLGTQIDLAKSYKTSETTSRKALERLVQQGLICRIKKKGTFISGNALEMHTSAAKSPVIDQICFVVNFFPFYHILENRFFIDVWTAVSDACAALNIPLTFIPSIENELPENPNAGFIVMLSLNTDQSEFIRLIDGKRPCVTIHGYFPHLPVPYVIGDNVKGGYLAAQHLISNGHKEIAIVLTGKNMMGLNQEFSLRYQGYKMAMEQHKYRLKDEHIVIIDADDEDAGYAAMEGLLRLNNRPTAVFFSSDKKALGGLFALHAHHIQVPSEMSLIGYDDQLFTALTKPAITTVNQNAAIIGGRSVKLLLRQAESSHILKEEVPPSLIIRDSVSPIKLS